MPIVFAAPVATPDDGPVRGVIRDPRRMVWHGFDGSVWPLTRPQALNPRLRPGVQGLHMPRMTIHKASSPLVAGVDLLGYSIPERSVYWPLMFRASSVEQWEADHSAFFDSFHPIEAGVWEVGEGEKRRTLPLTGSFDDSYTFERDPFVTGYAVIGLQLEAPRPLWRGEPIRREFGPEEGVDFIPPEKAPTFYISSAATFQSAKIANPGNEPAYLKWTVYGPTDYAQLGVGGSVIDVPFPVADGETLVIDTDPAGQYATLNGVDVTRELGFQMFAPVPPRGETPLVIVASGNVAAELVPLYWRAF